MTSLQRWPRPQSQEQTANGDTSNYLSHRLSFLMINLLSQEDLDLFSSQ